MFCAFEKCGKPLSPAVNNSICCTHLPTTYPHKECSEKRDIFLGIDLAFSRKGEYNKEK
jgi:hypothetical protein